MRYVCVCVSHLISCLTIISLLLSASLFSLLVYRLFQPHLFSATEFSFAAKVEIVKSKKNSVCHSGVKCRHFKSLDIDVYKLLAVRKQWLPE